MPELATEQKTQTTPVEVAGASFSSTMRNFAQSKLAAIGAAAVATFSASNSEVLAAEPLRYTKPHVYVDSCKAEWIPKTGEYLTMSDQGDAQYAFAAFVGNTDRPIIVTRYKEGWSISKFGESDINFGNLSYNLCLSTSTNDYRANVRSQTITKEYGDEGFSITPFPAMLQEEGEVAHYMEWTPKFGEVVLPPGGVLWGMVTHNTEFAGFFASKLLVNTPSDSMDGHTLIVGASGRYRVLPEDFNSMVFIEGVELVNEVEVPPAPRAEITRGDVSVVRVSYKADICPVVVLKSASLSGDWEVIHTDTATPADETVTLTDSSAERSAFYKLCRPWELQTK
jgi:hypothetical protein